MTYLSSLLGLNSNVAGVTLLAFGDNANDFLDIVLEYDEENTFIGLYSTRDQ